MMIVVGFQGGLRAVIWTDVFQFIIMMTGLLAVLIQVKLFTICCLSLLKTLLL